MKKPDPRQAQLAAIHMAQKALNMSAEDASACKLAVTGKASSADMTAAQRAQYLAHLAGLQGRPVRPALKDSPAMKRAVADPTDKRWLKARMLWALLAQAGAVRANTDAALTAYVKRQTHVEAWRFLNGYQVNTVIESLKRWCVRADIEVKS
jgi:phage gp16-like protein